jgi:phosphate transport system substrate-binding protein
MRCKSGEDGKDNLFFGGIGMKRIISLTLLGLLSCGMVGCGGCKGQGGDQRLNGGGSTFVYPMMSKWAKEYEKAKGVQVNYQSIGSGGGIQKMTSKDFDFGCSDAPLDQEQLAEAQKNGGEVLHIPLVMGPVVPIYNLPDVDKEKPLKFNGEVLAGIFLGNITKWNDSKLKKLNPDVDLPNKKIVVVHRSDGSGTTYIWVDYLSQVSEEWKEKVGVATSVKWPTGVGQKGNEAMARQTASTPGAIAYVELTYAVQKKIPYGLVANKAGRYIKPDIKSVREAAKNALAKEIPDDLVLHIANADGKDSYPISGTVYAVIYKTLPKGKGEEVVKLFRWLIHEGQDYTESLDYAGLPKELIGRIDKKLDEVKFK